MITFLAICAIFAVLVAGGAWLLGMFVLFVTDCISG